MKFGGVGLRFPKWADSAPPPGIWKTKKPGSFRVKGTSLQTSPARQTSLLPFLLVYYSHNYYGLYQILSPFTLIPPLLFLIGSYSTSFSVDKHQRYVLLH